MFLSHEAAGEARMKESEARANLNCAFVHGSTQSPRGSFILYGGILERQLYSLVFLSTKGIRNSGLHLLTIILESEIELPNECN